MSGNGSPAVLYAKRGAVAWVTLNRPDQFNAYNMAMRDDLFQILAAIHDDTEVRAMVLRGAGKAFSTGGDLAEFGMAPSPIVARWVRFRRDVWGMMRALPIPIAVHVMACAHGTLSSCTRRWLACSQSPSSVAYRAGMAADP